MAEKRMKGVFISDKGYWREGFKWTDKEGVVHTGYRVGHVVHTSKGVYRSNMDDNTTNPDTDSTGSWKVWLDISPVNEAVSSANANSELALQAANTANQSATNANNKAALVQAALDESYRATSEADSAAENAVSKASLANTAAATANTAASNADNKASLANAAANAANSAADNASQAAENANSKASLANTAAATANTAASNADNKASLANAAASNADEKAALANTASSYANNAAKNAEEKAAIANEKAVLANEKAALADTKAQLAQAAATDATTASGLAQTFEARLAELEATGVQEAASYCAASWADGELAPEAVSVRGSRSFALAWYPYLVNMAQNTGDTLTHDAAKRLRPNNWLRYEDGTWAPCVCVSAEDWALCDAALYLDAEGTNKYCDEGAFDAEEFYSRYGVDTPLYTADGTEVAHIRRPWETTSKDYSHFVGRKDTVWLCDTQAGDTGVLWRGIFGDKTGFDGADFAAYKLPPTGISPGPCCTVSNKTRNFFYLFQGDNTNCRGSVGDSGFSGFTGGRTYPRVNDAQQVNNMNWARANNAVTTHPYPVAEGGFHALNAFVSSMEAAYGTKYLHDPNLFSSGISSNNGCTNEATLLAYGGVRYRKTGVTTWSYANFNTNPSFAYNSTGAKNHFSVLLNREYPKMQVDEAQVALSYAAERGILPGQEFTLYGGTYWYEDVTGAVTLLSGQMNARLYKRVTGTITGYNSTTVDGATVWEPSEYEVEVVLRTGIMSGVNASGDIFCYFGGGCEAVGECTVDPNTSKVGNPVKMYVQPDQTKWMRETGITLASPATFAFESSYILLGETTNGADNYVTAREPYHPYPIKRGGNINMGECYYGWTRNEWGSLGKRVRIALRFRGNAYSTICSPRSLYAYSAASLPYRLYGCSAQILLPQG